MTTSKAKTAKAKTTRKSTKTAKPKAAAKVQKKAKLDETRKIKAVAGQEEHFYKGFPRRLAYELLCKASKRTLKVSTFLDKIEKLEGVKTRKQARGIVTKMVNKPGSDGIRNHQIANYV